MLSILLAADPPPWYNPAWITAIGGGVSAVVAALGAFLATLLANRRERGRTEDGLRRAAEAAERAADGVTNSHGTHLRDDLDEVRELARATLIKVEEAEEMRAVAAAESSIRFGRVDQALDVLATSITSLEKRSDVEHERLDRRIDRRAKVSELLQFSPSAFTAD